MPDSEFVPGLFVRDDDEGLFSRDINGQLVRLDTPTESDYEKDVTLQIDGLPVTVPLAEPLTDANGNIVVDLEGRTTPRYTTIFDAARKLYVEQIGDEKKIPIPVLCHQPHMTPVAVCRLCIVQIYGQKRGRRAAERKLLPACQHQVKEGMEVFTMNAPGPDGDRVRQTVKVVTELLAADHLKPANPPELEKEFSQFNELGQMTQRCGADASRFKLEILSNPPPPARPLAGRRASIRPLPSSWSITAPAFSAIVVCAPVMMSGRTMSSGGQEKERRPELDSISTFRWGNRPACNAANAWSPVPRAQSPSSPSLRSKFSRRADLPRR